MLYTVVPKLLFLNKQCEIEIVSSNLDTKELINNLLVEEFTKRFVHFMTMTYIHNKDETLQHIHYLNPYSFI